MKYPLVENIIGGQSFPSGGNMLDVFSPLDGEVISQVTMSDKQAVDAAVKTANAA
ncbi:MAG TPA: methylmalonate-semialdehyde dehydrogenase (CoA acylating), partial [Candidatus Marinimicrobia bacterium]|nr:methylmalonate-semialdehyde dehydrogenase (CoA acylating) [Candidatus Neomarinimicrobiota bacterium]